MKKMNLIASMLCTGILVAAASALADENVAPLASPTESSAVKGQLQGDKAQVKADREKLKADKSKLVSDRKAARASRKGRKHHEKKSS